MSGRIRWLVPASLFFLSCGSYEPPEEVKEIQVLYLEKPSGDRVPAGWLYVDRDGDGEADRSLYIWHDRSWTLGQSTSVEFYNLELASGELDKEGNLLRFPPDGLAGGGGAWVEGSVRIWVNGVELPRR